jgi:hypothetical protein
MLPNPEDSKSHTVGTDITGMHLLSRLIMNAQFRSGFIHSAVWPVGASAATAGESACNFLNPNFHLLH